METLQNIDTFMEQTSLETSLVEGIQIVERVEYQNDDEEVKSLDQKDVVLMTNGDIGAAITLYENGMFVLYDLGTVRELRNVFDIQKNLSILSETDLKHMHRLRDWEKGTPVEVFSLSFDCWCQGEIMAVIELENEDESIAHRMQWFQLKYFIPDKNIYKYKQLPWHSKYLRQPKKFLLRYSEDSVCSSASSSLASVFPDV